LNKLETLFIKGLSILQASKNTQKSRFFDKNTVNSTKLQTLHWDCKT